MSSKCPDLAKIPPNSWSGATKCPEKICVALYVMSLFHAKLIICYPHMNCVVVSIIIIVMNTKNVPRDALR